MMMTGPAHFHDAPLKDLHPDWDRPLSFADIPFMWARGMDTLQIAKALEVEESEVYNWRASHP